MRVWTLPSACGGRRGLQKWVDLEPGFFLQPRDWRNRRHVLMFKHPREELHRPLGCPSQHPLSRSPRSRPLTRPAPTLSRQQDPPDTHTHTHVHTHARMYISRAGREEGGGSGCAPRCPAGSANLHLHEQLDAGLPTHVWVSVSFICIRSPRGGSLEMLFPGPSQAWPCQAAGQSRGGMTACGRPGLTVRARPGLQQARQGAYCMLQLASGPKTLAHPPASPQALDAEGACQPGLGICTRSPLRSTEAPEPHQPQGLKTGRECTSGAPTLSSPDALQQFPWRQTGSTWHLAGGALSQAPPRSD